MEVLNFKSRKGVEKCKQSEEKLSDTCFQCMSSATSNYAQEFNTDLMQS